MKTFLAAFWGALLALLVAFFLPIIALRSAGGSKGSPVPDGATLLQPLAGNIPDYPIEMVTSPFDDSEGTSQTEMLESLAKAAVDRRIERVVLDLGPLGAGFSKCEELRAAIHRVRDAGKPVLAWAAVLDPKSYSVAVACDSIVMIPGGRFLFTGLNAERMYVKGLLDKLGVRENVDRIESYKSAAEMSMRTDMSPAARENAERLLDAQVAELRAVLLAERGLDAAGVDELLARPLRSAEDALESGLIDRVAHREEFLAAYRGDSLLEEITGDSRVVDAEDYVKVEAASLGLKGKTTIAVVHGQGTILTGKSGDDPFVGEVLGSETLIAALKRAARDRDVKALVLRLDTPGGDAWASDAIGREVERIRATKPVVISMGDLCASGGYMIAYRATALVALPTTLTGSIGSITGKYNLKGLNDKLGLTYDGVSWGPHAKMYSGLTDWTPEEAAMVRAEHWESYNRWIAAIAKERGMSVADVDSLGRGRVWTGREALERKLVDRLGGLDTAIRLAGEKVGVDSLESVSVVHFPRPRPWIEALFEGDAGDIFSAAATRAVMRRLEHAHRLLERGDWLIAELPGF